MADHPAPAAPMPPRDWLRKHTAPSQGSAGHGWQVGWQAGYQAAMADEGPVDAIHAALIAALVRYGYVEPTDPPGRELAVAFLESLTGAERLRADDSGVEVQLRAELAHTRARHDSCPLANRDWWNGGLRALERLAERLGIDLD